jgi:hypothetical protein
LARLARNAARHSGSFASRCGSVRASTTLSRDTETVWMSGRSATEAYRSVAATQALPMRGDVTTVPRSTSSQGGASRLAPATRSVPDKERGLEPCRPPVRKQSGRLRRANPSPRKEEGASGWCVRRPQRRPAIKQGDVVFHRPSPVFVWSGRWRRRSDWMPAVHVPRTGSSRNRSLGASIRFAWVIVPATQRRRRPMR